MTEATESLTHPAYGRVRAVTDTASVLLADNPGLLTLEGTNTWVLRGQGSDELVIVDPGPDDDQHIPRIASLGRIALVLISHRHADHTDGIDKLVELTGATVRSAGSGFCRGLGGELVDGEVVDAAGLKIKVMATPGHTADSLSFVLEDAVLTADTVLGRGTTVIDNEDGSLADYLESRAPYAAARPGPTDGLTRTRPELGRPGSRRGRIFSAPARTSGAGAHCVAGTRRRRHRPTDRRTCLR